MDWNARSVTPPTGTTRVARFAGAVAARQAVDPAAWLRCSVRTTGTARVLLRRRRLLVAGTPVTFAFAPRIELRLATSASAARDVHRFAGEHVARSTRVQPRTVSASSAAAMLRRAGSRTVRDDAHGSEPSARVRRALSSRPPAHADVMPADAFGPPARVLRRRATTAAPPPAPQRDEPVVRATGQPARPAPLSPVEINRLTDHIVHTIERRIAAFRERQGRV